jgi:hypothetical protein
MPNGVPEVCTSIATHGHNITVIKTAIQNNNTQ